MILVVVAILISHREKLALEKDIIWSICRAVVQLIIVGYVLKYIFDLDNALLTVLMVLFICFNAAYNAKKRSKYVEHAFVTSFIAITTGAVLTLAVLVLTGSIEFTPMQVIPISGMIAGNAMVAVWAVLHQPRPAFQKRTAEDSGDAQPGATPVRFGGADPRQHPRFADPDRGLGETVGLVSLPGMMSGLIFAGIDPVKAIKYQIMVTFMLLSTASLSTIIACYMAYRKFYNERHQLVVGNLK